MSLAMSALSLWNPNWRWGLQPNHLEKKSVEAWWIAVGSSVNFPSTLTQSRVKDSLAPDIIRSSSPSFPRSLIRCMRFIRSEARKRYRFLHLPWNFFLISMMDCLILHRALSWDKQFQVEGPLSMYSSAKARSPLVKASTLLVQVLVIEAILPWNAVPRRLCMASRMQRRAKCSALYAMSSADHPSRCFLLA